MPCPSILNFAQMANACYYASDPLVPIYTRVYFGQLTSGFKAARYTVGTGSSAQTIICFAGTDSDETEMTDSGDKLADLGFAGPLLATAVRIVNPLLGRAIQAGTNRLSDQISGATEFTRQALYFAPEGSQVFVTGHSLGGGLAQIIAASMSLRGVAFNAPAVSQLGYAVGSPSQFYNVNQARDPVSGGTSIIGSHLGTVIPVDSGASVAQAHFLGPLIAHLQSGPGGSVGGRMLF